jgi:hypothetical protein
VVVTAHVAGLRVHPLKGAAGVDVSARAVDHIGLVGDRRWLVVDDDGRFLSQRECPRLATLRVDVGDDGALRLPWGVARVPPAASARRVDVTVWRDTFPAFLADDEHHAALSSWLVRSARLVALGAPGTTSPRRVDPAWVDGLDDVLHPTVGFADGYGILVVNAASARAVEAAAGVAVPLDRWRANVVVDGVPAWAEERWRRITVGPPGRGVVLALVKPCARCVVTTIDQRRGVVHGPEPLATLARLGRSLDPRVSGALFGMNAVVVAGGHVAVGEVVTVDGLGAPWVARAADHRAGASGDDDG